MKFEIQNQTARRVRRPFRTGLAGWLLVGVALVANHGLAQQVWNGPLTSFAVPAGADWRQSGNQDHITADVWFARALTHGLFNAFNETNYAHVSSPAGTAWAIGSLANYNSLAYTSWESCYGGSQSLLYNIVGTSVVVHLIPDDIYLSLQFTSWGQTGGDFSYVRSTPGNVPEPAPVSLLLLGLGILMVTHSNRAGFLSEPRRASIKQRP